MNHSLYCDNETDLEISTFSIELFPLGQFYRIIVFPRLPTLQGRPDVHQGPGAGGGPDQAGHVPEVRTQEALVCQDQPPAHRPDSE